MNRSSKFGFYLPQNTDPISVSDFNFNFEVIDDNMLSRNAQTLTAAEKAQVMENIGADVAINRKSTWYRLSSQILLTTSYVEKNTYNGRNISDYEMIGVACYRGGNWLVATSIVPTSWFKNNVGLAMFGYWGSTLIEYDIKYKTETSVEVKKITNDNADHHIEIFGVFPNN